MPYACAVSFGSLVGCRRAVLERKTHAALMLRRMAMRQCSSPALSRAGSLCSSPARSIAATTMRAKEGTAARREAKLALTQKRVHEKACVFFPVLAWTHSKPFLPTATPYKHSRENTKESFIKTTPPRRRGAPGGSKHPCCGPLPHAAIHSLDGSKCTSIKVVVN